MEKVPPDAVQGPAAHVFDRLGETYERLALAAESLACTLDYSAAIRDDLAGLQPQAREHAGRDRRLAAAERAAAHALRARELPPPQVREVIRSGGRVGSPGGGHGGAGPEAAAGS
jgi:hypothetical protein